MMDRREEILKRVLAIATATAGIVKAVRNTEDFAEQMRPAAVLFDGGEDASEADPHGRPINAPRVVTMTPQLLVLLGAVADDVGSDINLIRARLVRAIQTDATLAALTLNDRGIRYLGCETNLNSGRTTEAEMSVFFALTYILRPSELDDVTA